MSASTYRRPYDDIMVKYGTDGDYEDTGYLFCGCVPLLPAAYLMCFLFLMEGISLILELCGVLGKDELMSQLDENNPFRNGLRIFLWIISIGDIIMAFVGPFGLWLSFNYMPLVWRRVWSMQGSISKGCIGSVLIWRLLVTFMVPPWVGVFLAFQPPYYARVACIMLTMLYVAVSVYLLYILLLVYNMVVCEVDKLQQRIDALRLRVPTWNQMFTEEADLAMEFIPDDLHEFNYPTAFCCLPLETVVIVYVLALFVGAIFWLVKQASNHTTVGGWAFLASVPQVSETFVLEIVVNVFIIIFSIVAIAAIFLQRGARDIEDVLRDRYQEFTQDALFFEDMDQAVRAKKRSTALMFLYLMFSLVRFGLFFPITTMVLVEKDICSLYVHGISNINTGLSITNAYCSGTDVGVIILMLLFFFLDAYMIYNTFRLWRYYQSGISQAFKSALPYGSAQAATKQVKL